MNLRSMLLAGVPMIAVLGLVAPAQAGSSEAANLMKSPLSGGPLMAQGLRNGTVHLQAASPVWGSHESKLPGGKKILKNVDASPGTTQPVDETPIAANPNNAKQLITGGNDYNCTSTSYRGFWTTNDGGKTWAGACAQDESGSSGGGGDPIVGYDLNGTVYQGGIDFLNTGAWAISVASSTDNGKTWGSPVQAVQVGSDLADKPWLQIDTGASSPNKNNIYISNTMFGSGSSSTIYVTTSKDGGKTWKSVAASSTVNPPTVNQFSDLAIGSDGTVYLSYMQCPGGGPTGDCGGTTATMYVQKSTDAGKTWSKAVAVGTANLAPDTCGDYYGTLPNTCERVSNVPSIAVDNSGGPHAGYLYLVDTNYTGGRLVVQVTTSTDGGNTWGSAVPVATKGATGDEFFPWLNVSSSGEVGVTWYDRRDDANNLSYEEFAAESKNGGASFGKNTKIATSPSNPNNDGFGGSFIGDYSGNTYNGKSLYASWTDTRNGSYSQDYVGGLKK